MKKVDLVKKVKQVLLVLKAHQEKKDQQVMMVQQVLKVQQEKKVKQVMVVLKV